MYQGIAQQLGMQPPFATTATNVQTSVGDLTLQSGFPVATGITNNYSVNPNYRLGYVQLRNLDIQQQIRPTLLLNLDYTGTKGTDLDILEAPNRTATGIRIPGVQAFTYGNSVADQEANAGSVRIRKRLSSGVAIGGTYTFSKSLDDASSIGAGATSAASNPGLGGGGTGGGRGGGSSGGGSPNLAQNPFDLSAERGLSSFNQTHKFSADYLWELPFGHDKRWLTGNSPWRAILGDWQWSGDLTIASGAAVYATTVGYLRRGERGNKRHSAAEPGSRAIGERAESLDCGVVQYNRIRCSVRRHVWQCAAQQHYRPRQQSARHGIYKDLSPEGIARAGVSGAGHKHFQLRELFFDRYKLWLAHVWPGHRSRGYAAVHNYVAFSLLRNIDDSHCKPIRE